MEWTDADTDLLERYARGTLTEAERTALENRIATDPEYAREAALTAESLSALKASEKAANMQAMRDIWDEVKDETEAPKSDDPDNSRKPFPYRFLAIAASVILLAVLGYLILRPSG